jgi:hypothetical protein
LVLVVVVVLLLLLLLLQYELACRLLLCLVVQRQLPVLKREEGQGRCNLGSRRQLQSLHLGL